MVHICKVQFYCLSIVVKVNSNWPYITLTSLFTTEQYILVLIDSIRSKYNGDNYHQNIIMTLTHIHYTNQIRYQHHKVLLYFANNLVQHCFKTLFTILIVINSFSFTRDILSSTQ